MTNAEEKVKKIINVYELKMLIDDFNKILDEQELGIIREFKLNYSFNEPSMNENEGISITRNVFKEIILSLLKQKTKELNEAIDEFEFKK